MTNDFLHLVAQLEVVDFIGLSKVLNVKIYENEKGTIKTIKELKIRAFSEVFEEMVGVFTSLGRKQKRQIIKMLKQIVKTNKQEQITKTNKQEQMVNENENENL